MAFILGVTIKTTGQPVRFDGNYGWGLFNLEAFRMIKNKFGNISVSDKSEIPVHGFRF